MRIRAEGREQKAEGRKWFLKPWRALFILPSALCLLPSFASASPTQEEVLRSINESVGESVDPAKLLAAACCIVALIVLLSVINLRRKRTVNPKTVNHPGKLLKQMARDINLKPAELKQLKMLADSAEVSSPLVLLLCPSLLAKTVKENSQRVDRQTLTSIVRKIGAEK